MDTQPMTSLAGHTGQEHDHETLSLTRQLPDGSIVCQSWTVCVCVAEHLRALLGEPERESLSTAAAVEATTRAARDIPGIMRTGAAS